MRKRKRHETECIPAAPKGVHIMIISKGKGLSVWVEGAERLLLALSHSVRIELKEELLCLSGRSLLCETYGSGAIEVIGAVEEIKFEKRRQGYGE